MNNTPFFLLAVAMIALLLVSFSMIKINGRPFRKIIDIPYRESSAYLWWLTGTVAMLVAALLPAAGIMLEAVDLVHQSARLSGNQIAAGKQSGAVLINLSMILAIATAWFWLWLLAGSFAIKNLINKSQQVLEMQLDNHVYFIGRSALSLMGMLVLLPFYLQLLRYCLPSVTIPFYR